MADVGCLLLRKQPDPVLSLRRSDVQPCLDGYRPTSQTISLALTNLTDSQMHCAFTVQPFYSGLQAQGDFEFSSAYYLLS